MASPCSTQKISSGCATPCFTAHPAQHPAAEPVAYKGKANAFWSKKEWSEAHDCNVYWDPMSKAWYRYSKDDDAYRQLPAEPPM